MTTVTKEMIGAGHDVLLKRGMVLSYEILTEIYTAMDQAAPPLNTPFDTCPTCESLARSVMLDQRGSDSEWEHTARVLDAALQELVVFIDERWGDNECRPLENAKHAIGLVKDEQ